MHYCSFCFKRHWDLIATGFSCYHRFRRSRNARLHVYGNNRGLLQIFDIGKHRELLITWYIMARMPYNCEKGE